MSCLITKTSSIIIAVISIISSIGVMVASNQYYWLRYDQTLYKHANLLQITASIILVIGVIKNNHRLIVPWMITSSLLSYFLVTVGIDIPSYAYGIEMIGIMSVIVGILLFYAFSLYVIYNYFQELRKSMDNVYLFTPVPSTSTSTSTLDIKTV